MYIYIYIYVYIYIYIYTYIYIYIYIFLPYLRGKLGSLGRCAYRSSSGGHGGSCRVPSPGFRAYRVYRLFFRVYLGFIGVYRGL